MFGAGYLVMVGIEFTGAYAPVADQAQLHGVLTRLRDIGATLLSLNALEASSLPGQP